jgi:hypothetical protein
MTASVSNERAFSQGGITISKLRNRLKGDIVEGLQRVKCAIQHDLLYREPGPSSVLEAEMNGDEGDDEGEGSEVEDWDDLLLEEDDDSLTAGMDMDSD